MQIFRYVLNKAFVNFQFIQRQFFEIRKLEYPVPKSSIENRIPSIEFQNPLSFL
jgi:hypothetical protein